MSFRDRCGQLGLAYGRVAKRTSSRLRRTNDRSVLGVHEDREDDENAEIGVSLHAPYKLDYAGILSSNLTPSILAAISILDQLYSR